MASAKSSRSRASVPSGLIATTGLYQAANGAAGQEGGVQLADKLKIFKTDNFDPDAYVQSKCQTMNEKVRAFLFDCSDFHWFLDEFLSKLAKTLVLHICWWTLLVSFLVRCQCESEYWFACYVAFDE